MESKRPDEPQQPHEPEESLQSSQIKKIMLGLACGVATYAAGWYLAVAVAAGEAYYEFNKPAFGGRVGGIIAGVLGGFVGGLLATAVMTTGVPSLVAFWLGYTRGREAVQDAWKATTDAVYSFTGAFKHTVYEWTERPRNMWSTLTSYLSKITDTVTSVISAKKTDTASVSAKSIAATDEAGLDQSRHASSVPAPSKTMSSTADLLRNGSSLRSSAAPLTDRPPPEVPILDSREESQVRKEGEPASPRVSSTGLHAATKSKQPAPEAEEGLVARFKRTIGWK